MNRDTRIKFTYKDFHCLARKIQSELLEQPTDCLYCK